MSAQPHIIEVTAMYRSDLAKAYKKPSTKAFTDWLNRSCNDLELKEELKGK